MPSPESSSDSFHVDVTLVNRLTDEVNAALPADLRLSFSSNTDSSRKDGGKKIEGMASPAVYRDAGTGVIPSPRPHVPFSPNIICNENLTTESPPSNVWRPSAAERGLLPKQQNTLYQNTLAKATNSMMQKVRSASMTSSTTGPTGSLPERNPLIDNEEGKDVKIDGEHLNLEKRKISVESLSKVVAMVEPRVKCQATLEQQKMHENEGSCEPANQCYIDDGTNRRSSFGQDLGSKVLSPIRFDDEEFLCGFINCRPKFLKPLTSPIVFLPLLSLLAFSQGRYHSSY